MSVRLVLTQKSRPYKIEIFGLQDNYIGTLQSYNDFFIGQVIEPIIEIRDDGSQSFACSIPKFYINPETNLKVENPRWGDIKNGILAENTRILKVFLEEDGETRVCPFIVDRITDKRDSHFSVYKEITCSGMAFSELGKQGYKIELNSHTIETDLEKYKDTVATINYWLDKVFPNERDNNGKVIKWLTPWCYEIRMDWNDHTVSNRLSTKVYEDSYVSSWALKNADNPDLETFLEPESFEEGLEKARIIDCQNSNKYNITQTIAETFGVFCVYEYKCDNRGHFVGAYQDQDGLVWTGRKVIFYNRAIKTDRPLFVDYQKNLNSISRTADSAELYTKLYITPIQSEMSDTGYISIADTDVNPLLDDFILNFDYLYNKGSITDYQYSYLNKYRVELYRLNDQLRNVSPDLEALQVEINDLKAKIAGVEKEILAAQETFSDYQTLRDNDVTNTAIERNSSNAYSVVFSVDNDCYSARLTLEGINPETIKGFKTYKYNPNERLFSVEQGNLIISQSTKRLSLTAANQNFYVLLNDYGFPVEIYTSLGNTLFGEGKSPIVYLELVYSPSNAYNEICSQLQEIINNKIASRDSLRETLGNDETTPKTGKYKELEEKQDHYDSILNTKEELNRKFELIMGPALREGYWTPESYEDPGQKVEQYDLQGFAAKQPTAGAELIFDDEYFDEEETGYYYDEVFSDQKRYYSYIPITDCYQTLSQQNIENLVIHLLNPSVKYVVTTSSLPAGNYYVVYSSTRYYFTLVSALAVGSTLDIRKEQTGLYVYINGAQTQLTTNELPNAVNLTDRFEGINNYLGERILYENAGFIFAFIKVGDGNIQPVLLLNDNTINYSKYTSVAYSFGDSSVLTNLVVSPATEYILYYPRIVISEKNVNYKSDLFSIEAYLGAYDSETSSKLKPYEDYITLIRAAHPYCTLKINNKNTFSNILDGKYYLYYQISRANEMLYLDAKEVARDNSQPKYSYDLTIANLPDQTKFIDLGQLVYINDHSLGVHAATGYVSGIKLNLAKPQDDELTIQNYKTKFEDLFSTITASSEAMKNNALAYDIAAAGFAPNGLISGSVLQTSIDNNNLSFNFSNTNVQIDDNDGIILTNSTPYMNGVYGQVALRGGGVFLSNVIDENGNRVWSTGITPNGINASLITTGQLDTNTIRIFAGNNLAFQWNSEGIFAYQRNEEGTPNVNSYVRFSSDGLQYISGGESCVDLGWEGLNISAQNGSVSLTGDDGLIIKNGDGDLRIKMGRFVDNGMTSYGMRLYKGTNNNLTETLITTNEGDLWLRDEIAVGSAAAQAGIAGHVTGDGTTPTQDVRFWAGAHSDDKEQAPFRVLDDGTLFATKGQIGSLVIDGLDGDSLAAQVTTITIESDIGELFQPPQNQAVISWNTNVADGYSVGLWSKLPNEDWVPIALSEENLTQKKVQVSIQNNQRIKAVLTNNETNRETTSNILVFHEMADIDTTEYIINSSSSGVVQNLTDEYLPASIILDAAKNDTPINFQTNTNEAAIKQAIIDYEASIEDGNTSEVNDPYVYSPSLVINGETLYLKMYGLSAVDGNTKPVSFIGYTIANTTNPLTPDDISLDYYFELVDEKIVGGATTYGQLELALENMEAYTDVDGTEIPEQKGLLANLRSQYFSQLIFHLVNASDQLYASFILPIDVSETLFSQLLTVREGMVVISDGKVVAESIVSNSIYTDHIATNQLTARHFKSDALKSSNYEEGEEGSPYSAEGSFFDLANGNFTSEAFYINGGNVGLKGTIFSTAGEIGGWIVEKDSIHDRNNSVGLYSGNSLFEGASGHLRFYAGAPAEETLTINDSLFKVYDNGLLVAQNANVRGSIVAEEGYITNKFYVGSHDSGARILMQAADTNRIGTETFMEGYSGWRIDGDGNAYFNNISARGRLSSVVFEHKTVSAVGGKLYVAPSISLKQNYLIQQDVAHNKYLDLTALLLNNSWQDGQRVLVSFSDATGENKQLDGTIARTDTYCRVYANFGVDVIPAGSNVVQTGDVGNNRFVVIDAESDQGPFIDVQDYFVGEGAPRPNVRIGNLGGIRDTSFSDTNLSGYGLYSQNAYLTGQLVLPNAGITNQQSVVIGTDNKYEAFNAAVPNSANNLVRFWAGSSAPKEGSDLAPFIVTQDGSLYASKGIFSGIVNATNGTFSGTLETAGIFISKDGEDNHFFVAYKPENENTPPTKNDYILDINSEGLSIYEGGLRAYSDEASGWLAAGGTGPVFRPYNYNDETLNCLPFFYLVDQYAPNENYQTLSSRTVAANSHIFKVNRQKISEGNYEYIYNSTVLDGGLWFNQGTMTIDEANPSSLQVQETNVYNAPHNLGLYQSGDTELTFEGTKFSYNGQLFVSNPRDPQNNQIVLGDVRIVEAYQNNVSVGLDFISN